MVQLILWILNVESIYFNPCVNLYYHGELLCENIKRATCVLTGLNIQKNTNKNFDFFFFFVE